MVIRAHERPHQVKIIAINITIKMRLLKIIILTLALTSSCVGHYGELFAQNKIYDISKFGAEPGTESLQTEYIQAAIDAANKNGGAKY